MSDKNAVTIAFLIGSMTATSGAAAIWGWGGAFMSLGWLLIASLIIGAIQQSRHD